MTNARFGIVPTGIPGAPSPYTIHVPQADIDQLSSLAKASIIGTPSFYNTHNVTDSPAYAFGATRDWLSNTADYWVNQFDWRSHEKYWNTFPQFTINVTAPSDSQVFSLHFAALFSQNPDAVPIIFSHGWPSSWLDFIPILELLMEKYTPETLPYHVVVPSIPDYGLSTRSELTTTELTFQKAAEVLNELMKALGFNAYIAQGGDIGSGITAAIGVGHDEAKAVHFNNFILTESERAALSKLPVTAAENASFARSAQYMYSGLGYMLEQGTKPAAISLILESTPIAMLGWIGTIYAEYTNYTLDAILDQVSWYWYTKSYGRSLWGYRGVWQAFIEDTPAGLPSPLAITNKPLGYSWYPGEVLTVAKSWMEHWFPDNLAQFSIHESGGHFASVDDPAGLLQDIEDFVAIVKTKVKF
ncbi:Alpha/Beta hydrolase protein [Cercophora newfieldiana]|uniref:Alpha/Beta hydrolase protein n=1 Tax=Cercophora newfieldiana TaxID=92897 RepID=A0AA39XWY9_9PEZI|nr:Alpha/Beta hydrolase protein [Cercophora newfieldiana]